MAFLSCEPYSWYQSICGFFAIKGKKNLRFSDKMSGFNSNPTIERHLKQLYFAVKNFFSLYVICKMSPTFKCSARKNGALFPPKLLLHSNFYFRWLPLPSNHTLLTREALHKEQSLSSTPARAFLSVIPSAASLSSFRPTADNQGVPGGWQTLWRRER